MTTTKKSKILFISLTFDGGTPQYAQNLANYLDLDLDIVVSSHCDDIFLTKEYQQIDVNKGGKNALYFFLTKAPFLLFKLVTQLFQNKYDALYVSGPLWLDLFYVIIFRLFRKKVFYTVHEGVGRVGVRKRRSIVWSIRLSTHLIFLSNYQKNKVLKELKLSDKKVKVIYHTDIKSENLPTTIKRLNKKPKLALIGTIGPYKGFDILLNAIKMIDSEIFESVTVAGRFLVPIPEDLPSNINIINRYLTHEEMHHFFMTTEIMLLPYTDASQSGIAAQSIGYLIPSIITPIGALEEQFHGLAYVTKDLSSKELAKTIELACLDEVEYKRIGNGLFALREKLSWPYIANEAKNFVQS